MNSLDSLQIQIAENFTKRIQKMKPENNSAVICEVQSYDVNTGAFIGKAPDGSLRYFRFIGNASLPIGSQVSVVLPEKGLIGWADTKAR